MKTFLHGLVIFLLIVNESLGQVGINTDSPTADLEVVGDVIIDDKLFLENPDAFSQIQNSKLIVNSVSDNFLKYDINVSKYGPINYVQYDFTDLSTDGLLDYDTKIPTNDYTVTIKGYYFLGAIDGTTSIVLDSLISNNNIEGYQIYAYPNGSTNTWFLRAFINNARFQADDGSNYFNTSIELFLNVIIYRNGFITKDIGDIIVDMGNSETITVPLPAGF